MLLETLRNRYLRIILTGILLFALFPFCPAFADDYEGGDGGSHNIGGSYPNFGTVWYGPTSSGTTLRYGVVAYTKYDAAMYCLYSTTLDFDNLNPVKKQKLLAGSAFTTFANKFQVGKPDTTSDWATDANIIMSWNSARNLYGETYCYSAIYTYEEKVTAKTFVDSVLNDEGGGSGGESGGGGDGPGFSEPVVSGSYVLVPLHAWKPEPPKEYFGARFNSVSSYNTFSTWCKNHNCDMILIYNGEYYQCLGVTTGKYSWNDETYTLVFDNDVEIWKPWIPSAPSDVVIDGNKYYTINIAGGTGDYDKLGASDLASYKRTGIYYRNVTGGNVGGGGEGGEGGGGDEPTEPPVVWPDPPEKPVGGGPDVPGPGDDPVTPTPPDPVEPTPGNPWIPIPDDDVDITGDDFQDLLDALNEHCIHLQNSIQSNVSQLWDLQSEFLENQFGDLFDTLNDNFSWLGTDVIAASFTDLKDYLHQLFEWLADQMEFNINVTNGQYNDSSVVYWLKQIWSKMGDGVNTQPADPLQEPDDWWAWLFALMSNFVTMLLAFGSDRLADVTSSMQSLTGKFPFSLPWDLAALYALLDAPAVVPEFDLPCIALTSSGLSEVGTYHITLEPYDDIWEGVRWVERIGFAVMLIRSTHLFTGILRKAVGND